VKGFQRLRGQNKARLNKNEQGEASNTSHFLLNHRAEIKIPFLWPQKLAGQTTSSKEFKAGKIR
jgi:hypothetical protein